MRENSFLTRRQFIVGALGATALAASPILMRRAFAADEFKIGVFIALTGSASMFGATQKGCAELAADEVNAAGGILGKKVNLVFGDAGKPPAEAAQTAMRFMLNEKVNFFVGSHDSAVREALVATIKGKIPYVYTPIYEGGECAPNTYVIADAPQQQMGTFIPWFSKKFNLKSWYMIGNDYVWPHGINRHAKKYISEQGGSVIGEEYVPLGAPNKYEEVVTRIKGAKPDIVLITLVGADNINFNRTFAGFGLDKNILRMSGLLEENTLLGIGEENSKGLYGCMSYYANIDSESNRAFSAALNRKFNGKPPVLSLIGEDCYCGIKFAQALVNKAGSTNAKKVTAASEGLSFKTPGGVWTMHGRHVDKTMYIAECKGTQFNVIAKFEDVKSGEMCR
jgi:urea transport system substrate-binding protein